jgi:mannose PTS system EIIA component
VIAVLVISHEPLGTALLNCTRHVFGNTPPQTAALDVMPNEDPEQAIAAARELIKRISDGSGVLVLTDLYGATPSRIAKALFAPHRVAILGGVSLPMVIKALSLRRTPMPLTDLVDQVKAAGEQSIQEIFP